MSATCFWVSISEFLSFSSYDSRMSILSIFSCSSSVIEGNWAPTSDGIYVCLICGKSEGSSIPLFCSILSRLFTLACKISHSFYAASNNFLSSGTVYSLFTFGLFLIDLARLPKRIVLIVSYSLKGLGEQVMTRQVFELPPRDSDKILVSLLSLYGMWVDFLSVSA
jgi:hypothetical protein